MKTQVLAAAAICFAGAASATTVDIDLSGFAPGDNVSGLTVNGATIGQADIGENPAGDASLISFFIGPAIPIRLDFASDMVTSFMANGSDFGQDEDNYVVEAYGVGDILLDTATAFGPEDSEDEFTLSVSGSFIDYVLLYDTDPFAGAVYWSDLSYTISPIPLPAGGLLLIGALGGLAAFRKRAKNQ